MHSMMVSGSAERRELRKRSLTALIRDGDYIVSFIGFAPADDPELLVYIAVDSPKNSIQFGGVIAAPIVGRIIEEIAPLAGIEKREGQIEKEYRWGDPMTHRVPDLTGMTRGMVPANFIRIVYNGMVKATLSSTKCRSPIP